MSGSTADRTTLIWNEQTKLLANALDRASTGLGVGSLFPLYLLVKPPSAAMPNMASTLLFVGSWVVFLVLGRCATLVGRKGSAEAPVIDSAIAFLLYGVPTTIGLLGGLAVWLHGRATPPVEERAAKGSDAVHPRPLLR